jgi:hypothetical protein
MGSELIIYNTAAGKTSVALYARDGDVWMNQSQLAELFDTSIPNISMHISNILKEKKLNQNSVLKNHLTTAADGKQYEVTFYSLVMILAMAFIAAGAYLQPLFKSNRTFSKVYFKVKPKQSNLERFTTQPMAMLDNSNDVKSRKFHKKPVFDFLKPAWQA